MLSEDRGKLNKYASMVLMLDVFIFHFLIENTFSKNSIVGHPGPTGALTSAVPPAQHRYNKR